MYQGGILFESTTDTLVGGGLRMGFPNQRWRRIFVLVCGLVLAAAGCEGFNLTILLPEQGGSGGQGGTVEGEPGPNSQTTFMSSTLSGSSSSGQAVASVTASDDGLVVTPDNVTGEVLSLLFAIDNTLDDGVVIFGNNRPDVAPASSDLEDYDLANPCAINSTINNRPDIPGGTSSTLLLLFGYMDMHFTLDGDSKIVRVALASVSGMTRGDKLLFDTASNSYLWYDLDASAFSATRPSNPAVIEEIRDFFDPIRPNMVFYPVQGDLVTPEPMVKADLVAASSIDVVLDFLMTGAILLESQTDASAVSDATLVTSLTLSQVGSSTGESGIGVDSDVALNP